MRLCTDEPLAKEDGAGALTYFHADALGSVAKTTNQAGAVAASYSYDAFGSLTGGAAGYGYTGREWDSHAQLYYYRARYYDPSQGRFLSEDPAGFQVSVNFYAYVDGNPLSLTDPFGLAPKSMGEMMRLIPPNNESGQSDELVLCQIWLESRFDMSGGNGGGFMQMFPGAKGEAKKECSTCDKTDPAGNIKLGTIYLKQMIRAKNGSVRAGLAAYKWGAARPPRNWKYADKLQECERCLKGCRNLNDPFETGRNGWPCLTAINE